MAHFYGTLQGAKGQSSRCGSRSSGIEAIAAGWRGAVRVRLTERNGQDHYTVELMPWHGVGERRLLAEGELGAPAEPTSVGSPEEPVDVSEDALI